MKLEQIQEQIAREETPVRVHLTKKTGEPVLGADGEPAWVEVVGEESKRYQAARKAMRQRLRKRAHRRGDIDDSEREEIILVASAVVAWSGIEGSDGEPLPCTPENVKKLLAFTHIRNQVELGIADHALFFESASES